MSSFGTESNPLLEMPWSTPHGLPPFASINPSHFEPAFYEAAEIHLNEIKTIVENQSEPTFDNTVAAYDNAGKLLTQVAKVAQNLFSSNCPPDLQEVQMKLSGPFAAHSSAVSMYPGLFERINSVYNDRHAAGLTSEQVRLTERKHLDLVREGARFDAAAKTRYTEIMTTLAELTTTFTQNVMKDEASYKMELTSADLTGLPEFVIQSAKSAAIERELPDSYVVTLSRSLVVPFLTFSDRRDLREIAWRAWTSRGELDSERDNIAIAVRILTLREEQAKMHGYETYADFSTADSMAGTPAAVMGLLERVWTPAKASFERERTALQEYIASTGQTETKIECWDWRYYAEKVRQSKYDIDESEVKPYFTLEKMIGAVFDCANKLFGLTFVHRPDIVSYHPDVKTYEVYEDDGNKLVGIFLHDNYARSHKQGGAWMSDYRSQHRIDGENIIPIITNNNNFAKGDPCLLSYDDAKTLFHEFGHGMHGMLSDVTYDGLSGTNVLRDFVELPSQLFEHWLSVPEVLKQHARHYETDEPIPDELLARLMAAKSFNMGFDTVEYTASALVDQALHNLKSVEGLNLTEFESNELNRLGMPESMVMRHRPAHFSHLFSGSSYAAAYYVYLWAEVLDADGFDAFLETGDAFNVEVAKKVRQYIYSSGNSIAPAEAFRMFRGREPIVEPMLKKKGLLAIV